MKKFFQGFKEFAMRGNVMDMAVGVIIGAAFKAIIDSLVGDIISPLIGAFTGTDLSEKTVEVGGVALGYGAFITAIINFLIVALVLYIIISSFNKARELKAKSEEAPAKPTTKTCPFCQSEIPLAATRCPHCTSELPE